MPDEELTFNECIADAVEAIKDAMGRLDLGFTYCPSCMSRRYNNFNEKKEGDALAGAVARLESMMSAREKRRE